MPKRTAGLDERVLATAQINLSNYIFTAASQKAEAVQFGWLATDDAPTSFDAVLTAYERSRTTGERFPVYAGGSESTIYLGAQVNHAFRFLHDLTHAELELDFTPDSELRVAVEQMTRLRQAGFEPGCLEWHLFHADLVGQLVAGCVLGRFVIDQKVFVLDVVNLGLKVAIEREGARTLGGPVGQPDA